jgi:hypothetical protein
MMKKFLFSLVAPLATMVSMLAIPMQVAAQPCCPAPCDPCEDECCDNGWLEKLGLVLVAAGAGALAGWGAAEATKGGKHHHHGHDHECTCPTGATGFTGPTGPSPFTSTTDVLTFALGGTIGLGGGATGASVEAFVTTPDGRVFSITALTFTGASGTFPLTTVSIVVPNATLGTYEYGFVFPLGTNLTSSALSGTVVTSRNALAGTELFFPATPPPSAGAQAAEFQIGDEFAYGSATQFP